MTTKDLRVGMVIKKENGQMQIITLKTDLWVYAREVKFNGEIGNEEYIAYDYAVHTFETCDTNSEIIDMNTVVNNYLKLA